MKRLRVLAVVAAMLAALLLSSGVAMAAPGASQACSASNNFDGLFPSHGACVSTIQTYFSNGNASAVGLCKLFDNFGYSNQGACVSELRHFGF